MIAGVHRRTRVKQKMMKTESDSRLWLVPVVEVALQGEMMTAGSLERLIFLANSFVVTSVAFSDFGGYILLLSYGQFLSHILHICMAWSLAFGGWFSLSLSLI